MDMSEPTVFDRIVSGELPSHKVWEDDNYMAFLTRWPNTPGYTVVIPKKNPGDNYLNVDDETYTGLLLAAKKVAAALAKAFGCYRVGLVLEGEGVPHLHVKLIPMHGVTKDSHPEYEFPISFTETYKGYLTTNGGPELSQAELKKIQKKIQSSYAKATDDGEAAQ